jgi:tetrahydromethanopterin S-methyltransferase subunit G
MGASASRDGDDRDDWPEYWGKRIGRALGMIFLLVVIYWLYQLITGAG